jgi:hypothetical protein
MEGPFGIEQKFKSPEEELAFLREQVAQRERELMARGAEVHKDQIIADKVKDYAYAAPKQVLHPSFETPKSALQELALNLSPEEHDTKIAELMAIMNEKGIKNALSVVEAMDDFHVEDDFHRFLVQYLKKGFEIPGLKPRSELFNELSMTLYEVSLPTSNEDEPEKPLKEVISAMEQFYAGMLSIDKSNDTNRYFTLEIANPNHSEEFIFYVCVPDEKKNLFEKQILSFFHDAKIHEVANDYNIFNEKGVTMGSYVVLDKHPIFPIKTYDAFDHDPMNAVLNTFSKIKKDGEGAAIQIVFRPPGENYIKTYKDSLDQIQKGVSVKKALPKTVMGDIFEGFKDALFSSKEKENKEKEKQKETVVDQIAVEHIKAKISSPFCEVNIRFIASANNPDEATKILSDIESSFNQFDNPGSNGVSFKRFSGRKANDLVRDFAFRAFNTSQVLPFNFKELTSLFHFPGTTIHATPQLRQSKASAAAAPLNMPQDGTLLGINRFRNIETKVFMTKEDRLRHMYVIGQTGTGKSTLLKNMVVQDILQGEGVCMIDPHGVDILDVLANIPKERYDDVIYFDPSYTPRPMGLNMLEYDTRYPEQKTFVVNEMLSIFNKLFDMKTAGGPMFEQYFRNAVMLTIDDPESGSTLLDVSKLLANKQFRDMKLAKCKNPLVVQFWKEVAEKAGGEASLANIVPYITSKFDNFLSNDIMRPIISQQQSSFNFREIMDNKKILLVNLAKGRLGDINANLIGLILVGKILMAALSRADALHTNPPPFYLYIDEFQNVTTDSISAILSEARKYKLSLNVAHQFIAQLEEGIRDSVFGNVGSMAIYRVGADDAEYLEKQLSPVFTAKDIINIENRNAYLKILVNGKPVPPFNIEAMPPPKGNPAVIDKLKELSYLKFGQDRAIIEAEIMEKYKKPPVPPPPPRQVPPIAPVKTAAAPTQAAEPSSATKPTV